MKKPLLSRKRQKEIEELYRNGMQAMQDDRPDEESEEKEEIPDDVVVHPDTPDHDAGVVLPLGARAPHGSRPAGIDQHSESESAQRRRALPRHPTQEGPSVERPVGLAR